MELREAAAKHDTDKADHPHYQRTYEELLGPMIDRELKLLELGVLKGGSLLMWRDYLPRAIILGLDRDRVEIDDPTGRVRVYQGEQQDTSILDRIAAENAPDGLDVIIDDASHIGQYTRISFWHLFENHLKPGGLYIIEDWGCSYWNIYPDGKCYRQPQPSFATHEKILNWLHDRGFVQAAPILRELVSRARYRLVRRSFPSHTRGMVGFIKELVDECGMEDVTDPERGLGPKRHSRIETMRISLGQVVIVKTKYKNPT